MTYEWKRTNNAHTNTTYMVFPLSAPCILRSCQTSQIGLCIFLQDRKSTGHPWRKRLGTPNPHVPTANETCQPHQTRGIVTEEIRTTFATQNVSNKCNITVRRTACISNDWCLPLFSTPLSCADMEPYQTTKQIMLSEFWSLNRMFWWIV